MKKRSFLASLAGLFCARKVPAVEPPPAQWVRNPEYDEADYGVGFPQVYTYKPPPYPVFIPGRRISKSLHWQTGITNKTWHGK